MENMTFGILLESMSLLKHQQTTQLYSSLVSNDPLINPSYGTREDETKRLLND
jgi:hypothetical protein